MSYFRANNVKSVTAGQTGSLTNAWGVLAASGSTGTLYLQKPELYSTSSLTSMSIAHLAAGVSFPCFPNRVEVVGGTVYLLA